jgi:hypothetical protein
MENYIGFNDIFYLNKLKTGQKKQIAFLGRCVIDKVAN